MDQRSIRSSRENRPKAIVLSYADEQILLNCGVDSASLPYLLPKLIHKNLLVRGVKVYAANILKQTMLSIGGDVAVHRHVITGKIDSSDCVIMGDLRHFSLLLDKLKRQPGMKEIIDAIGEQIFPEKKPLSLDLCNKPYRWETTPVIMGILNITPDSFSDGGKWIEPDVAVSHALDMIDQGAQIIDIGGESSRPGARPVDTRAELSRVVPAIRAIASHTSIPISIDTKKADVALEAIKAGACIINDISALSHDPAMIHIARDTRAGIVLMHMRGTPESMQKDTFYENIVYEIYDYLSERIDFCLDNGIDRSSIIIDPGIGFGKDLDGNLSILNHLSELRSLKIPLMLGHSRKAFLGDILGEPVTKRQGGTDTVSAWGAIQGVDIIRVHDIGHAMKTRKVINAILGTQ